MVEPVKRFLDLGQEGFDGFVRLRGFDQDLCHLAEFRTSFARRVRSRQGGREIVLVGSVDRAGVSQRVDPRSTRSISSCFKPRRINHRLRIAVSLTKSVPHADPEFAKAASPFAFPFLDGHSTGYARRFQYIESDFLWRQGIGTGVADPHQTSPCDAFSASSAWLRRQPRSAAPLRPAGGCVRGGGRRLHAEVVVRIAPGLFAMAASGLCPRVRQPRCRRGTYSRFSSAQPQASRTEQSIAACSSKRKRCREPFMIPPGSED